MITRTPHYYREFKCLASECSENCCCGGWLIELDEDTAGYYLSLDTGFGKRLRESFMTDEDGSICFKLEDGRCPHLDENGLCRVCAELGEEHMGFVCREFPRYSFSYGDVTEKGIGLACGEAARIILNNTEEFFVAQDAIEEADCDDPFIRVLLDAREDIFNILSDRSEDIRRRIVSVLELASELQERINSGGQKAPTDAASGTDKARTDDVSGTDKVRTDAASGTDTDGFDPRDSFALLTEIFDGLELLNEKWSDMIKKVRTGLLEGIPANTFREKMSAARTRCGDLFFENLMNYFVFRYFMKAVYDYDPLDKIRFAVCSCLVIWEMLAASAFGGEKGTVPGVNDSNETNEAKGRHDLSDPELIMLVETFSRQVEYSEENVDAICEEFLFGDDFTVDRLTAMVLV